ncbi:MAG: tRNA (adenosine(37)-N6)-threonylcarbamoyltransferase complex transferase subunit TsaD [Candidatus Sumerlaeaceae bacterium]
MLILGIETSCDETSVALVENGHRILANDVASQVKMHAAFGGVVPELASRAHIQRLVPMVDDCLVRNQLRLHDVDAIAVTLGPGLVGALLVGVETAKGLAFASGKRLIPVHHIAGHLYSPFVHGNGDTHRLELLDAHVDGVSVHSSGVVSEQQGEGAATEPLSFPYVGLVVSGGHSSLVLVHSPKRFELLGETIDDAAGEAFDKLAKLLGLGYPGGPLVERAARNGDRRKYVLPRPMLGRGNQDLNFSFSGLKTAALKLVKDLGGAEAVSADAQVVADVCASFQEAVVEVLLRKAGMALERNNCKQLALVGGVACNGRLREATAEYLSAGIVAVWPPRALCTDNAAMIAGLAYHFRDMDHGCDLTLNAQANLPLI